MATGRKPTIFFPSGVSETDLAWAAGLFEGEGCINVHYDPRTGKGHVRLFIVSTDLDVLRTFQGIVNGTLRPVKTISTLAKKPQWRWYGGGSVYAREFITHLQPYMHSRRSERMDDALRALERVA